MAGGGKSSQTQEQTYTDNRVVQGQDALYANNGSSVAVSTSTNNYTLDGGAIDNIASVADTAIGDSGSTARQALAQAFSFGSDALSTAAGFSDRTAQAVTQSLNFASDASADAFSTVRSAQAGALSFGGDALAFGSSALGRVLDASTHSTDQAFAGLAATENLVANAYNDAKGRGAMTDKLIMGAVAAMAIVAFMAVKK